MNLYSLIKEQDNSISFPIYIATHYVGYRVIVISIQNIFNKQYYIRFDVVIVNSNNKKSYEYKLELLNN